MDVYSPASWEKNALLQPEAWAAYAKLLSQGWIDSIRTRFPGTKVFTFWDFFRNHFERDAGLRIDHVLLTPDLKLVEAGVDRAMRGNTEPSDHAPVWVEFEMPKAGSCRKSAAATTPVAETDKARRAAAVI